MENVSQKQMLKTDINCTVLGQAVTISYEKETGKNPGRVKAINANATIANPASTETNPLPPIGNVGVNFSLNSWISGNIKNEDVAALIAQLEAELLAIVNA